MTLCAANAIHFGTLALCNSVPEILAAQTDSTVHITLDVGTPKLFPGTAETCQEERASARSAALSQCGREIENLDVQARNIAKYTPDTCRIKTANEIALQM